MMKKHIMTWVLAMACMASLHGGVEPNTDDVQILNLNAGWNWIGLTILPTSHKIGDVLGTAGLTANDVIQASSGSSRFTGGAGFQAASRWNTGSCTWSVSQSL